MVTPIPQLPPDFYGADPVLEHIRRAAYSDDVTPSPDATLGVLLCRIATLVPLEATLPGIGGTVNYVAGIVGPSGAGKSSAARLARRLVPKLGEALDGLPIGSGEGMIEAYLRSSRQAADEMEHHAAYFYVDEAETFIQSGKRDGSTTLATLRSLWSGADAGQSNASRDTSRRLRDGSYRFAAAIGFQPAYAYDLITNDKAGTPQRFVLFSALDRYVPDVGGSWPGLLSIACPSGVIEVAPEIRRLTRERLRKVHRGEIVLSPLDTHRDYKQKKTAALLSVLCGARGEVTERWWNLARRVVDTSDAIVEWLRDENRREDDARQADETVRRLDRETIEAEKRADRIGALLAKYVRNDGPQTWEQLHARLAGRDRPHATRDLILEGGWLVIVDERRRLHGLGPRALPG